jgi:hypothetical protein
MRWPWPFSGRGRLSPAEPSDEAREALRQARRGLVDAERVDCAAQDIAARLAMIKEINGFSTAVIRTIRGV